MITHFLLEAELEILEAATFYHERSEDIAAAFFTQFKKARDEIAAFPEFWKPIGGGYRRKLLERFPYGIIYRVAGDKILIVALAHTRRHPEYWWNRSDTKACRGESESLA